MLPGELPVILASWNWQTTFWAAIWLLFPLLEVQLRRLLKERGSEALAWFDEISPWIYGLAPAFGAWVLGWVPGRLLGFNGRGGPFGWILIGLLLLGIWLVYWKIILPRTAIELPDLRPEHALLPEARWAFYRGVGWLWLGNFWWGVLLGFTLTLVEWGFQHKPWLAENRNELETCYGLALRASSTLVFALSANLWFTMFFQAGLLLPLLAGGSDERQAI